MFRESESVLLPFPGLHGELGLPPQASRVGILSPLQTLWLVWVSINSLFPTTLVPLPPPVNPSGGWGSDILGLSAPCWEISPSLGAGLPQPCPHEPATQSRRCRRWLCPWVAAGAGASSALTAPVKRMTIRQYSSAGAQQWRSPLTDGLSWG